MPNSHASAIDNDPLHVLGVSADATPEEIRAKYLELVKMHPPDRDPARFAEIRAAVDRLSDPVTMLRERLFSTRSHDSIETMIVDTRSQLRTMRIPTETLLGLAKTS